MMYKDVITALKNMGQSIFSFLLIVGKVALFMTVGIAVCGVIAYVMVHHFLALMAMFGLALVSGWFYIEYTTARVIREYEEMKG